MNKDAPILARGSRQTDLGRTYERFEIEIGSYPDGSPLIKWPLLLDNYDPYGGVDQIDRIMVRPGKLVIRPDSGDPVAIICGDPSAPIGSPAHKGVVELLWETFGGTTTATGHKMLDEHIGVIYGDSITEARARAIVENLAAKGFASANMVFGIGSYTYQFVTRDVYGFAMKATWVEIDGYGREIFKDPVTDSGMKKSAKGRLAVVLDDDGEFSLIDEATPEQEARSLLIPVWMNGEFLYRQNFAECREIARSR